MLVVTRRGWWARRGVFLGKPARNRHPSKDGSKLKLLTCGGSASSFQQLIYKISAVLKVPPLTALGSSGSSRPVVTWKPNVADAAAKL